MNFLYIMGLSYVLFSNPVTVTVTSNNDVSDIEKAPTIITICGKSRDEDDKDEKETMVGLN